jgi:hypothetical protein
MNIVLYLDSPPPLKLWRAKAEREGFAATTFPFPGSIDFTGFLKMARLTKTALFMRVV